MICDKNGLATIPISAVGGLYVSIYHIGFKEFKAYYTNDDAARIILDGKPEFLNEAVVTQQYQKRSAAKAVERVQIIDEKMIKNTASVNLADALQIRRQPHEEWDFHVLSPNLCRRGTAAG